MRTKEEVSFNQTALRNKNIVVYKKMFVLRVGPAQICFSFINFINIYKCNDKISNL